MQFSETLALKIVSLLLALILWVTILNFKREEIKKPVKLEPLLSPGMMVTNKIPDHITFTLSGPRVLLKDVERKIQPIRPDLRRNRETTLGFSVTEDLLGELPSGVKVVAFYPPNFLIRLEDIVEKYIPVKPSFRGSPAVGYELASATAVPSRVAVAGARSLFASLEAVGTEPIDLQDLSQSKEVTANLEVDTSAGFQLSRERSVKVTIYLRKVR